MSNKIKYDETSMYLSTLKKMNMRVPYDLKKTNYAHMKNSIFIVLFTTLFFISCKSQPVKIVDLQCEHLVDPLGIDTKCPRFSWQIESSKKGVSQTAFRILVGTDSASLKEGKNLVWDSGIINRETQLAEYKGTELKNFTRYFWEVIVYDEQKTKYEPATVSSFETAVMNSSGWTGEWISDENDMNYKPAPYFRKKINLTEKIKSARIYISAAGLYELSVNGQKVGDRMLDPMYTRFDKRNLYSTFDITPYLQEGKNTFGVLLGNGWFNHQSTAVWFFDKAPWRNRPRFLANIRIVYENGQTDIYPTDASWKTTDSPVILNSIYTAEHYDARKELPGWNEPEFDDSGWKNALVVDNSYDRLVAQQLHPIRITDRMEPDKMDKKNDSCYVFSFPRNIAGIIDLKVKGKEGTVLKIKHGERLDKNGYVDQSNIDLHYRPTDDSDPFHIDIFILSGNDDHFSPKFNYKGFQYVEITSSEPVELKPARIKALEMHSDVPKIGYINSSNPTLDKIWAAGNSSYLANLFGYPTDCPQREKNGWTGDSHIAIETGLYSFDAITVYEKWLNDFRDEQQSNGVLPNIIPTSGWGYDWANGPDWTSAVAIIPWEIYEFYGDSRLLNTMYDNIKKYVDYIHSISPNDTTDWGLGDWVPVKTVSSKTLTSSLFYYGDVIILSKAAKLFGKDSEAGYYAALAERIKTAINTHFLDADKGIYCSGSQTELAAPLYWGIVPEKLKSKVAENLYDKVVEKDFHIDTGILGAKALLHALTENGYAGAAYKIASQETYPSWGYWIVNGATTFYENWKINIEKHDASLNHIMFGDINAWMFKGLGGIYPDEVQPGFKHIILKPNFVDGLEYFEASHVSPYGKIVSKWEKEGDIVYYTISIPANCTATFYIPGNMVYEKQKGKTSIELLSGNHKIPLKSSNRKNDKNQQSDNPLTTQKIYTDTLTE
ncbi:alpha-rhamnosidase [Bacteroidia bacterium]|nr:alpha-rhamnosidase [Bacteroidia bacterium]GHV20059.1 alpha-rhamnosidase [Bacteroidia bacterium]